MAVAAFTFTWCHFRCHTEWVWNSFCVAMLLQPLSQLHSVNDFIFLQCNPIVAAENTQPLPHHVNGTEGVKWRIFTISWTYHCRFCFQVFVCIWTWLTMLRCLPISTGSVSWETLHFTHLPFAAHIVSFLWPSTDSTASSALTKLPHLIPLKEQKPPLYLF